MRGLRLSSYTGGRLPVRLFACVLVLAAVPVWPARKEGPVLLARRDLEIVECLLPAQVRQLGYTPYLASRQAVRTTAADCGIRGGEFVAYDRADYQSALAIWMPAAQAGDPAAQTNVGEILERGVGGTPDPAAAAQWYRKAADQGYTRAQFDLGTLYEQGAGVPRDPLQALDLYRRAWGLPADSLVYSSAVQRERDQLSTALAEKDRELELLSRQLEQLQKAAPPPDAADARAAADAAGEIKTLKSLIERLKSERSRGAAQLSVLPAAQTREPLAAGPVAPLSAQAQVRQLQGMHLGRYYALVIGNQRYQMLEQLQTPHTDVERIAQLLRHKYGFSVQVIEDANDVAILRALNDLNKVLHPDDNVLIYYAGHGSRMRSLGTEIGYWLPVNADRPPDDTFWVPNEQITAHVGRLPAQRVLVIADSCYAGLLSNDPSANVFGAEGTFSLDYLKYKLHKRARLLISSGGDSPVLDGGGDGDSVFARALIDTLEANQGVLTALTLFREVQERVRSGALRNHVTEVPELKAIRAAGHELGDFFLVPRS